MRALLSNNSLFVSQLYEEISLALRTCDLIISTTDLQTVNYYSTIHFLSLSFSKLIFERKNCLFAISILSEEFVCLNSWGKYFNWYY